MTHPFGGSGFRNQTTGLAVQEKERGEGVGGEEGGWYPVDRGRSEQRIQLIRVDDPLAIAPTGTAPPPNQPINRAGSIKQSREVVTKKIPDQ